MAQAGLHGLVGIAVRKLAPKKEWLILGLILGSILPDADILLVAIATVAKLPTENLHRTFTHSIFTAIFIFLVFWIIGLLTHRPHWTNLGIGLGIGVLLHIALDLLLWFNGVALLWPINLYVNLWQGIAPPVWLGNLLQTAEFLFLGLFFIMLDVYARERQTDLDYLRTLRLWIIGFLGWFVLFSILVFVMKSGFTMFYGLFYMLALGLAIGIVIRMRKTIEAA